MTFDIESIVTDVGESFTMSGVAKTFGKRGDNPSESYTDYYMSGVVQVMDGTEDEVTEGLLQKNDIMVFVDEDEPGASSIKTENYLRIETITSGIFRVENVVHNTGHYEVHAHRIRDTTP